MTTVITRSRGILALTAVAAAVITSASVSPAAARAATVPPPAAARHTPQPDAARLPLAFTRNDGQAPRAVRFLAQGHGVTIAFTRTSVTVSLARGAPRPGTPPATRASTGSRTSLTLAFRHASSRVRLTGQGKEPGTVNYLLGGNPARWHSRIPAYAQVVYRQLWPGIDATFTARNGTLRYWFTLAPHARLSDIQLAYPGARHLAIAPSGALAITTGDGILRDQAPASTQTSHGHTTPLTSRYRLTGGTSFGYTLGRQLPGAAVTIDPGLEYSTYLGGSQGDTSFSIATDAAGDLYIFGMTNSPDFPTTPGGYQHTWPSSSSIFFVTKLNPSGSALLYSTYVGDPGNEVVTAYGAVDSRGDAYVTGDLNDSPGTSDRFPAVHAYRATPYPSATQSVVFKLNPAGSRLAYSTYLAPDLSSGGLGQQIAAGAGGSVTVIGNTTSDLAPTTRGAFQAIDPGSEDTGYVARLDAAGSRLIYGTYLGAPLTTPSQPSTQAGIDDCLLYGLAVSTQGAAYVAGECAPGFPTTPGAYQANGTSFNDGLLAKLSPSGTRLDYATYYGTPQDDDDTGGTIVDIYAVAVDHAGDAYITAVTPAGAAPATPGASQANCSPNLFSGSDPGDCTAVAEFNPTGTGLIYSTYFGGNDASGNADQPDGIAVDASGNAYITGDDYPAGDIPVTPGAYSSTPGSFTVPFYLAVFGKGNLLYASYFGGTSQTCVSGGLLEICGAGGFITPAPNPGPDSVYLGGFTAVASGFPTTPGSYQPGYAGGPYDAFGAKLDLPPLTPGS